ncbi:MAG: hypothetical protein WBX05_09020 [Pseudolabrys sp.]|jgi:hypothetical protein
MRKSLSRGDRAVKWIETYCIIPSGPEKGQHARLSVEQRATVRQIYDNPDGPQAAPVTGNLAAYLALLHVCGPEALQRDCRPEVSTDVFTVWGATGPDLREVLKRDGDGVVCPELRTRYPVAA